MEHRMHHNVVSSPRSSMLSSCQVGSCRLEIIAAGLGRSIIARYCIPTVLRSVAKQSLLIVGSYDRLPQHLVHFHSKASSHVVSRCHHYLALLQTNCNAMLFLLLVNACDSLTNLRILWGILALQISAGHQLWINKWVNKWNIIILSCSHWLG